MDWIAADRDRRARLRVAIRKEVPEMEARLQQQPELTVKPTCTLAARRQSFNHDLQKVMAMLHRRHVVFSHIPRKTSDRPARAGSRPHPFTVARGEPLPYVGPTLTPAAKEAVLRDRALQQPKAAARAPASPTAGPSSRGDEHFESVLATSFSPRRADAGGSMDDVAPIVHRSWFTSPPADPKTGTVPVSATDPSRPTASMLRRQGRVVDTPLHKGDGYVSGADRLELRKQYAEEVYGYRRLRKHDRRPMASTPQPSAASIKALVDGSVFVRAGDVGSYMRQDALSAANGMLRADVRKGVKVRLGGTSKPRN